MKIHEYQAKQLFKDAGIPVPAGALAETPEAAATIASELGGVVAVKAQVHVGGRGKAGGIKVVRSPEEARAAAQAIIGMDIKGSKVNKVWVEKGSSIAREAYLGITLDRSNRSILFIASAAGGIDIEEVAAHTPEKIIRFHTFDTTFPEAEARAAAGKLFEDEAHAGPALEIMRKLFDLFVVKDASLAEINPLVLTGEGQVVALDGKLNFDDNALFRQPDIEALRDMAEENPNEIEAKAKGLSFVQLEGDIGCMVNGAGLAMATMDMVKLYGGQPANFLDVGGSSNPEKVINAFKLILSSGTIKAVLINIFGGITRCDDIARGILESFKQIDISVPVVVRLTGTNAEEGLRLLEGSNLIPAQTFAEAVRKVILAAGGTVVEAHS
ncbi:MAG TPA: ADP-forming succinate--CoA ligase subunit beta [Kiritimatiellia bacterium]|nr:ADP-forming succinate--CoA ligase subunit beta [Kiritimatiellia bacterium]HMO99882.1 ADP-forming succinate--CoA ligase subunit beta [Kiritimatiellia bacterium]HMP96753.1 ADP-forming succinate--CoA ligase subunit beta [Kiritimatiellia bacterium]